MPTKPTTPPAEKKPRVIDPEIEKLRNVHKQNVALLQAGRVSAATLTHITEKLLPKLTQADLRSLYSTVSPLLSDIPSA